jgi:serine/threonine protein kinase
MVRSHEDMSIVAYTLSSGTLHEAMTREGFAGEQSDIVVKIARQAAQCISSLHNSGGIHCSISARSFYRHNGSWKLGHFECTKARGEPVVSNSMPTSVCPPEVARLVVSASALRPVAEGTSRLYDVIRAASRDLLDDGTGSSEKLGKTAEAGFEKAVVHRLKAQYTLAKHLTGQEDIVASVTFDVWSFGLLLYQMSTGRSLFNSNNMEMIADDHAMNSLLTWKGADPRELMVLAFADASDHSLLNSEKVAAADLISKCLAPDPMKRPQSMAEVLRHRFFNPSASRASGKLIVVSCPEWGLDPQTGLYEVPVRALLC